MKLSPLLQKTGRSDTVKVFGLAILVGMLMFIPFIIKDGGLFLYYGDFNVQQVPFWQYCHEQVRSGDIFWSWLTDLGSGFIGSYSFYLLGSPFFWITLPFPSSAIPYLMGPLLILKMGVAAVGAHLFIRKFVKDRHYVMIGALLYAFSGFTVYNVFFNHFIDVVALFPFLMIAFENLMNGGKRGPFAIAIFINLCTNYFFFAGEIVFLIIYFLVRISAKDSWTISARKIFTVVLEGIIGIGMTAFLILPSFYMIISNPRLEGTFSGWGFFMYGNAQRYLEILHAFLFPPQLPHYLYFLPEANDKWQSTAGWFPFFSMTGVFAWMFARKKTGSWPKRLVGISIIFALIPGLGSLFYLMKSSYYSRWLFMPILIMAMMSAKAMEDDDCDVKIGFKWTAFLTLGIALPMILIPNIENGVMRLGLYKTDAGTVALFFLCVFFAVMSLALFYYLYFKIKEKGKIRQFKAGAIVTIMLVSAGYGIFIIGSGKMWSDKTADKQEHTKVNLLEAREDFSIPGESGDEFYRIDVLGGTDNTGLFWRQPTINFFHSVVSSSILEFYPTVNVQRDVATRADASQWGLRVLTSVKYVFDRNNTNYTKLFKLVPLGEQNGHYVYQNPNFIPLGFTYDFYVTEEVFSTAEIAKRDQLLVKAILLDEDQIEKYGSMMTELSSAILVDYTEAGLIKDAADRRSEAGYNYTRDNEGFSIEIDMASDNLVFFSVPYDEGWTATINGKPAAVEKVDNGLMAVPAGSGHNIIRMDYMPKGLEYGVMLSLASLAIFILYVLVFNYTRKKRMELEAAEAAALAEADESKPVEIASESEETDEIITPVENDQKEGSSNE